MQISYLRIHLLWWDVQQTLGNKFLRPSAINLFVQEAQR